MTKVVHPVYAEFKALNSWALFCLNVFILFLANNSGSTNLNHSSIMLECAIGRKRGQFPAAYSHRRSLSFFLYHSHLWKSYKFLGCLCKISTGHFIRMSARDDSKEWCKGIECSKGILLRSVSNGCLQQMSPSPTDVSNRSLQWISLTDVSNGCL